MTSIRILQPAIPTANNGQPQNQTQPQPQPTNQSQVTMPGQPTYQRTAGAIQRTATKPVQQVTMPGQPTYQKTAASVAAPYTPGRNWDQNLAKIGQTVNKAQNGGYQNAATAPQNSALVRQNQAFQGAQNSANVQAPAQAGFQQSNLQEGFDADYLQKLSAAQIDPLKQGYEEAIRLAGADFNRLGLRGSGFEVGEKFGGQPGSITSRYMEEMGNVARDVALRGAEAEREDRYRQADMNEASRQNWSAFDRDLSQQNFSNQAALLDASGRMVEQDESSRQYWTKDELDRDLASRDYQLKAIETGMQADQQDQANQQWAANFQQGQLTADDAAMMDRWKTQAELLKWDAERGDRAREFDSANDLSWANFEQDQMTTDDAAMMDRWKSMADLQKWDTDRIESSRQFDTNKQLEADQLNANVKNQGLTNLLNLLNSQGATATNMQNAYWKSLETGQGMAADSAANQAQIGSMIQELLMPKQQVVPKR